jgi:hypothetical protein
MRARILTAFAVLVWASAVLAVTPQAPVAPAAPAAQAAPAPKLFETADRCQACHNGLVTPTGRDVSIGVDWRASMMAHSARDPYWQAGVRRETLDHPVAAAAIEHECSRCHMPMAHVTQVALGGQGQVFAHLPVGDAASAEAALAADGVSCTVCHQIQKDKLGTPESYTGHFVIDTTTPADQRQVFGPFAIDAGLQKLMHSATTFTPAEGTHVQSSELCATCHTLFTHTLDDAGKTIGTLPEQVPYLEWRHSAFRETKSCQTCHMPVVEEKVRVSSTLGEPRDNVSRHTFRGANFWMLRVFNRFRAELGIDTLPQELELAASDTLAHLERESALVHVEPAGLAGGVLAFDVRVVNRGGHKLPTAYPSRRVWLHTRVTDTTGRMVFESGAPLPTGAIDGNDNDRDALAYEPHYAEITSPGQVPIYENIMVDAKGAVTTGLLSGLRYVKDNRLLPDGFDKATGSADIAVHGEAATDSDFTAGGDRVRYRVPVTGTAPFTVTVEVLYQSVGHRWAENLRGRNSFETDRFVRYYDAMKSVTTARLAAATATMP